MKFAVSIMFITLGYAVLYCGVCMYQRYDVPSATIKGAIPLRVLIGIPTDAKDRTAMDALSPKPPFRK